jgi:hypothetical protein
MTTFARQAFPVLYPTAVFLNADEIQLGDGRFANPVAAGREMLERLSNAERLGRSFAIGTLGGHPVPESDIRRRFHRGIDQFQRVYKRLVDEWYHWKSDDEGLHLADHHET